MFESNAVVDVGCRKALLCKLSASLSLLVKCNKALRSLLLPSSLDDESMKKAKTIVLPNASIVARAAETKPIRTPVERCLRRLLLLDEREIGADIVDADLMVTFIVG